MAEVRDVLTKIPNRSEDEGYVDDVVKQASQEPMEEYPERDLDPESRSLISFTVRD